MYKNNVQTVQNAQNVAQSLKIQGVERINSCDTLLFRGETDFLPHDVLPHGHISRDISPPSQGWGWRKGCSQDEEIKYRGVKSRIPIQRYRDMGEI